MDFINEMYHTNYELKLDIDKYCYYADETNRNIMIKLISDYRKNVLGDDDNYCNEGLERFEQRLNTGPVFVFFEKNRVAYDNVSDYRNIKDSYAAEMEYDIVKLNNRGLMTFE